MCGAKRIRTRLRQIDIVKRIDVGDQLFNQGEAFRGDKISQIGDRDVLVVDGRCPEMREQRQLVDLGGCIRSQILLDLAGDIRASSYSWELMGGMS